MQNLAELSESQNPTEVALENFQALLDDADFSLELELLGIRRMQFMRRRQMLRELRGLYAALWRLALGRSFPEDAENIFSAFLYQYLEAHPDKQGRQTCERARQYWAMLEPTGDADFSSVARHLTSFSAQPEKETKAVTLRLALHIRKLYRFIFDRLI